MGMMNDAILAIAAQITAGRTTIFIEPCRASLRKCSASARAVRYSTSNHSIRHYRNISPRSRLIRRKVFRMQD
jgi:hypothetical protein